MTTCEQVQIGVEMRLRERGGAAEAARTPGTNPEDAAHVATCAECRRYADVARASSAGLRARSTRRAAALDPATVRTRAETEARRFRGALVALVTVDVLGTAATWWFVGWVWALAMFLAGIIPPIAAYFVQDARLRPLLRAAAGEGDLFSAVRADLSAQIARLRWMAPLIIVIALALGAVSALELPELGPARTVVHVLQIAFDLGFVALGIWFLTRIPGMRRELAELGTAGDA